MTYLTPQAQNFFNTIEKICRRESALAGNMRFAPSPTGYLHLGHVFSYCATMGCAQRLEKPVLLRIEDHDRSRLREPYITAIYKDLAWLGSARGPDFDEQPFEQTLSPKKPGFTTDFYGFTRQTAHPTRYQSVFENLLAQDRVYPCVCTRKEIMARLGKTTAGEDLAYDGHCWKHPPQDLEKKSFSWRLRVEEQTVLWHDPIAGDQSDSLHPGISDFIICDKQAQWTYHFCVVIDDLSENIRVVVRGQDIFSATPKQLYLWKLLTQKPSPIYIHHPLIRDSQGKKLSKRHAAACFRQDFAEPAAALGAALYQAGWTAQPSAISLTEYLQEVKRA